MENKCIWFLGLSGAGKTTLAEGLANVLKQNGQSVVLLDGDILRTGLNKNLGFTEEDRSENVRRTAEVAKLFLQQGYWVLVALITPLEAMRKSTRQILGNQYLEVFVDTPLAICQARDPKGLYEQVANEKIKNFTGIDSPFEIPNLPFFILKTENKTVEETIQELWEILQIPTSI